MKKFLSVITMVAIIFGIFGTFADAKAVTEDYELVFVESGESGEYGDSDIRYVDAYGNEIESGGENGEYQPNSSGVMLFAAIPKSFDAREHGMVTSVKDQGASGNCWAFASMAALEHDALSDGADINSTDFSEAHLVWFAMRGLVDDPNDAMGGDGVYVASPYRTGGNWIVSAGALSRWSGIAEEVDYPFYPVSLDKMGNYDENSRYDRGTGRVLESAEVLLSATDVKQWVYEHGGATVSYYTNNSYYNNTANSSSYYCPISKVTNHAVTVIGWDDNYSKTNFKNKPSGNGAWLCKNSWGDKKSGDGYFWISYYDKTISNFIGYTSRTVDETANNYSYNGAGYTLYLQNGYGMRTANVFKAENCEKLNAVSFYTPFPALDVTISVYTGLPENYKNPTKGVLSAKTEVYVQRTGYHTIELPEEITLSKDMRFSVVVKMTDSDGMSYAPIEYTYADYSYRALDGESFFSVTDSNSSWSDMVDKGYGNAMIQAYTYDSHNAVTEYVEATCETGGSETTYCGLCGEIFQENKYANAGHLYGEWSEYEEVEGGRMVSTHECVNCEKTESKSYVKGNSVSLYSFISLVFERFFQLFRFSF